MTASADLRLGFVPLCDSAPLVVALEKGFFADEGLRIVLSRELSWATIRDKVAAGALDGAHMLAPMTLATSLGVGGERHAMIAPLALNRNGAVVTLSRRLTQTLEPADGDWAAALARHARELRDAGEPPLNIAVVFTYSMHNYLLRYWMARGGVDPDRDIRLTVAPPSRMAERLAAGELDGFCAGEPWGAVAVQQRVGQVVARSSQIWPNGPEKVFGVSESWVGRDPDRLQALLRALLRAGAWCDAAQNRAELAALLGRADYVGVGEGIIAKGLGEIVFHRDGANAPLPAHAGWLLSQMMRWGQIAPDTPVKNVAEQVYRFDLFTAAARAVGMSPVAPADTIPGPSGEGSFRLADARAYAAGFRLSHVSLA